KTQQIRTVRAGDGFLSQSSSWAHFGLGQTTTDLELSVRWPGGATETFSGLQRNTRYTITQNQKLSIEAPTIVDSLAPPPVREATEPGMNGFWVANRIPFPNLQYTDNSRSNHDLVEHIGNPVLVNLWATWCEPCIEELTEFAQHRNEIDANSATVLALNVDGLSLDGASSSTADPSDVLKAIGFDFPQGVVHQDGLAKLEVLIEYLSSRRSSLSLPTSFLVDQNGNVAAIYMGKLSWQQLAQDLSLLRSKTDRQLTRLTPRPGRWLADPRQVDRAAYLSDYATKFALNGLEDESQRLFKLLQNQGGVTSATDHYNQAKSAAQQGRVQEAIGHYREAIRLNPNYGQALTGLGAQLLMQKQIDEAQQLFEKALKIDPNHATALINLAMIDQSRGNVDSALRRLRTVVSRNPDYVAALVNLGSLLASIEQYDEAIQYLSKAVTLDPRQLVAHLNLANAYSATNRFDEAKQHYLSVQQLNPRMPHVHFGLGMMYAKMNEHADAVNSLRNAISLGGANARTYLELGRSLVAVGQQKAAAEAFERVLELDPKNDAARQAISSLTN
ncbi:MAG: tetratricopeptide repeat protein, partial [Planctomycetales bacterium]|nr:tetratricopeptide repeat protein [Planctomycetales bacterium]